MPDPIRLAMIGEGAIADIHMRALSELGAKVPLLVYGKAEDGEDFATRWGIDRVSGTYHDALASEVDGLVIASPSGMHAEQALMAVAAGKHALVEIPVGLTLADCEALAAAGTDHPVVMACHTRRFSPAHRWVKAEIEAGRFTLQHLVAETFFFRRENLNMAGKPRSWVDSLLWHHAAHTIDLFVWLTGDEEPHIIAQAGPDHPELGIPMDVTIGLKAGAGSMAGALLTLSMSFNNRGPFGGFYRYIGDTGTYHVFRDELGDHERSPLLLKGEAFLDQDRAFLAAIRGDSAPAPTPADVLPAMRIIDEIDRMFAS